MDPDDFRATFEVLKSTNAKSAQLLEEILEVELCGQLDELPLQGFCYQGGSPVNVEVSSVKVDNFGPESADGKFHLSFTERSPSGCEDKPHDHRRIAWLGFELDMKTGALEFQESDIQERDTDSEL